MKIAFKTARILLAGFICLVAVAVQADFEKSPNDHREYRALELENRMRVLLISDAETDEAAAALAVQVGGQDDPENRQGMAHYLEHMLFLGTEKYPELDGYRTFIEQNGGFTNAYTAIDVTNYNFSIKPEFLEPALDRFAHFFISPLFPEEQIDRERTVVHAEYEMRTQRDAVRRWSALRATFNEDHPSAGFFTGTSQTLEGDLRPELIDFHNERYSANLMNLVVLGREPLDELEELVTGLFSAVEDSNARPIPADMPLFESDTLPALLKIKTLKNNPGLEFFFPVPDLAPYWRESPDGYIAHLLGHEGEGSLLSELKRLGWADGLYASSSDIGLSTHAMTVRISLTPSGYENFEQIGAYLHQYIREIRKRGIDEWRFNEIKTINEISFRFSEVDSIRDFVTVLAARLHEYPRDEILSALYLVERFDPELIMSILERMHPENVLVVLEASDVATDQVTPYVGAEYALSGLDPDVVAMWNSDIADASHWLPGRNEFLPQNLDLKQAEASSVPVKLAERPGFSLWHQTDTSFDVPRAGFFVTVRSPAANSSVDDSILLSLFVSAVNEQLNEFAYAATVAGLEYSLYSHQRGFSIRVSGYDDNQSKLLEQIVRVVKSPKFDPDKFELDRKAMIRDIENSRRDSAYRRAISEFYSVIIEPSWTDEQELEVLGRVTVEDLEKFSERLLDEVNIVALSHGNVLGDTAVAMGELVASELLDPERTREVLKNQVVRLPSSGPHILQFEIENADSAIVVYVQGRERSLEERANLSLLAHMIQTPFFSDLRTVQQLGYVVFSSLIPVDEVPGLIFSIQSPDTPPEVMKHAIFRFLEDFDIWVKYLPDEEFEAYRQGLIKQILARDKTLSERSQRYWHALDRKDFDFDDDEELARTLEGLQRAQFEDYVRHVLVERVESRLVVMGYGEGLGLAEMPRNVEGSYIADPDSFKRELEYFPPQS